MLYLYLLDSLLDFGGLHLCIPSNCTLCAIATNNNTDNSIFSLGNMRQKPKWQFDIFFDSMRFEKRKIRPIFNVYVWHWKCEKRTSNLQKRSIFKRPIHHRKIQFKLLAHNSIWCKLSGTQHHLQYHLKCNGTEERVTNTPINHKEISINGKVIASIITTITEATKVGQ